ncbi:MAG: radical SAM protein [Candidatus Omnitrophica bacterium]|nr:radical SAM protein [Candidatus Omnitrophota bacterium]
MQIKGLIRKTESVCPKCLEPLAAAVIERDGKIFLSKECSQHGEYELLLSNEPLYYKKLDQFYFEVMKNAKPLLEYELWPTLRCNMNCSMCCFGEDRKKLETKEPTCEEIEEFIKDKKHSFYILSGGEPTCRKDIHKIIRVLKKHDKTVTINTNGLKLADLKYLQELKNSGLDRVNLQFDGFHREIYRVLRNSDLLKKKIEILDNLKVIDMPTTINAVVVKNVNDDDLINIIDFGIKNDFVSGINFFTICYLGGARNWAMDNYIMPDELIDILDKKSSQKINRKDVFIFQKLHLAIKSFLKQRYCFYNQVYLLVRYKDSYKGIASFLNLGKADPWLDRYQKAYKKNKIEAVLYLALAIMAMLTNIRVFLIAKEIFLSGISYFLKTGRYLKNRQFLSLSFSTGCDPYKFDKMIVENCQNEIIAVDAGGKLVHRGREGLFCMDFERLCVQEKHNL